MDQPVSDPVLPRDQVGPNKGEMATNISAHLQHLRGEVTRLRHQLDVSKKESKYLCLEFLNVPKKSKLEQIILCFFDFILT